MKKLSILFLFSLILFQVSAKNIDERMTDIYFGNGILTTKKEEAFIKPL